jgi:hypothetical protein
MIYEGKEDDFQKTVARYLNSLGVLWCHSPNGGSRNVIEASKLKAMGVKRGVPDVLIFETNKQYNGMAIELKAKKNKATPEQLEWIEQLTKRGWYCIVSNDLDQVIKEIDNYLLK